MKPRLLIIHNRLVIGGPALDIIPLAYHLRDAFEIHVLYGCKEKDETEPSFLIGKYKGLKLVNIPTLYRSPLLFKDIRAWLTIYRYIREFRPDIVHTHGAKVGFLGRLAAKRAKVPLILHTFHGHLFHSYFNRITSKALIVLERQLLRITDFIIAVSETQKKELQDILRVKDPSKIKVVKLGVDYIDIMMKDHYRQAFRRTYGIDRNTICIGMLGRMVGIKNPVFFLEVAADILQHHTGKPVKFFVIGDGSEVPAMKRFLSQKKIDYSGSGDSPVVFTSWVQNIQSILEGLDIVVLTSFNEGTPLSLIEAQLCSKPVVAADVGGVRDTMLAGQTGYLISNHDVKEFSRAITRLADDDVLRKTMGEQAREFASKAFSKAQEIESMQDIYMSYKTV